MTSLGVDGKLHQDNTQKAISVGQNKQPITVEEVEQIIMPGWKPPWKNTIRNEHIVQ